MKPLHAFAACAIVLTCLQTFAGTEQPRAEATAEELNPQRFELAVESGYLFGAINPPTDYQIFAESRTITSGSISECVTTLFDRAAGSFPTFRAGSVWDGSIATRKFLVARARISRSIFYQPPGFPF